MRARDTAFAQEATRDWYAGAPDGGFRFETADRETLRRAMVKAKRLPLHEKIKLLANVMEEGDRVALAKSLGVPPAACGPAMVANAPARGELVEIPTSRVVPDGAGGTRIEHDGYRCRSAMRAQDVLDRIRGLSPGQIEAGRRYAALTEAVAGGGMKCTAGVMVASSGSGGSARDFMDIYSDQCDRLRRMHRVIGTGIGMPVRRVRPSDRGTKASIRDRALVDRVCLGGQALVPILTKHGWTNTGRNIAALGLALADVLERLRHC